MNDNKTQQASSFTLAYTLLYQALPMLIAAVCCNYTETSTFQGVYMQPTISQTARVLRLKITIADQLFTITTRHDGEGLKESFAEILDCEQTNLLQGFA